MAVVVANKGASNIDRVTTVIAEQASLKVLCICTGTVGTRSKSLERVLSCCTCMHVNSPVVIVHWKLFRLENSSNMSESCGLTCRGLGGK